ncbi:PTS system, fructose-specific IIB component [Natronoarchaeum philippinense]|uniref:PTS system, fructose-specific IIB component n=1 Tax=Natronoarchaeum philippinense TaxID=558529 RepID=A0A285NXZ1_NATPI|nr:PTS fructose transporter subunit IIB [Natronoarchaeum philippinense]SNZ12511.1 PTS system, fructose-specific IIB component [Natronoarchaeum philippinense]
MKFVAVTACPTGIAHSQMAAENLETTAEERGHDIHVEVQGAMGTENEIPDDTLAAADAVIIAADTSVPTDRFDGKIVVDGPVKDAVNDAGGMIDEAVERAGGDADASSADEAAQEAEAQSASSPPSQAHDAADADEAADASATDSSSQSSTSSDGGLLARLKKLFS